MKWREDMSSNRETTKSAKRDFRGFCRFLCEQLHQARCGLHCCILQNVWYRLISTDYKKWNSDGTSAVLLFVITWVKPANTSKTRLYIQMSMSSFSIALYLRKRGIDRIRFRHRNLDSYSLNWAASSSASRTKHVWAEILQRHCRTGRRLHILFAYTAATMLRPYAILNSSEYASDAKSQTLGRKNAQSFINFPLPM